MFITRRLPRDNFHSINITVSEESLFKNKEILTDLANMTKHFLNFKMKQNGDALVATHRILINFFDQAVIGKNRSKNHGYCGHQDNDCSKKLQKSRTSCLLSPAQNKAHHRRLQIGDINLLSPTQDKTHY
uniref:Uncharacterized protein n=1 Tax=Strongyloides papillosus TaxID=174720 RepID=A0A0N5CII3_STREA